MKDGRVTRGSRSRRLAGRLGSRAAAAALLRLSLHASIVSLQNREVNHESHQTKGIRKGDRDGLSWRSGARKASLEEKTGRRNERL